MIYYSWQTNFQERIDRLEIIKKHFTSSFPINNLFTFIFQNQNAQMLQQLKKVINIAMHPKGGVGYILSKTRSISSFNINKNISAIVPDIATILDVGANVGQFATAANKFFPQCTNTQL